MVHPVSVTFFVRQLLVILVQDSDPGLFCFAFFLIARLLI